MLWIVVDKKDIQSRVGRCVSALSEFVLDTYAMDLAVTDKEPRDDRLGPDDIIVFLDKDTYSYDCNVLANDLANDATFKSRKRGGPLDDGEQNIAVFDVSTHELLIDVM